MHQMRDLCSGLATAENTESRLERRLNNVENMLDITLKCRQEPLSISILIVILVRLHTRTRAGVMRKVIGPWLTLQRPSAGACDNSEVDSTPKWLQ